MFSFPTPSVYQASKCYASYGVISHLDPKQPPSKGKPWTTFTGQDFVHKADLLVPQEAFDAVHAKLVRDTPAPVFKRVIMSLHDAISGHFFYEYIKKGDIMMLSEGRRGLDNVFCLKSGQLTMYLDKEAYERTGMVGKPHGVKGKRGVKPRWIVELDLTNPSMVPGKKTFDRLLYTTKNAHNAPITWMFCNLSATTPNPDPLAAHFPTNYTSNPAVSQNIASLVPNMKPPVESIVSGAKEEFEEFATEIYEWLSLVRLRSPRIQPGDQIDPYLCRYQVPGGEEHQETKICKISWQGFLSPSWSKQTLVDVIGALPSSKTWFSFSTTTFSKGMAGDNAECTILRPPGSPGEYVMWEIKSHE
ncbi:ribonuclease P 40kDa subunit-domain-containing protein [Bombardia bombarda]|uniref:Ribonuclease P 40kDa subunit-domain-containing protein n=1 Tax=Bombardia bombarda TaxID=252184 RepID=A0AA39XM92_9PEZI|nr:ribonuclease P 40kDa subunit-domain-containing protein [Bombardia bombarda]